MALKELCPVSLVYKVSVFLDHQSCVVNVAESIWLHIFLSLLCKTFDMPRREAMFCINYYKLNTLLLNVSKVYSKVCKYYTYTYINTGKIYLNIFTPHWRIYCYLQNMYIIYYIQFVQGCLFLVEFKL